MRKNFICGLDIGTAKICAACGILDPAGKINILAREMLPTQGIKAGKIIDIKKLTNCLKGLIGNLNKTQGIKLRRVYANIDSPDLRIKVVDSLALSNIPLNRRIIHSEQITDSQNRSNIVVVSALIPTIDTFLKCIRAAGLILADIVPSGCAQALGFYKDFNGDMKNNVLIDIGAGLTKVTLFSDRTVREMVVLPQGASGISEEIAARLKLSYESAEQLKMKYGRVVSDGKVFEQKIILKDKGVNRIVQAQQLYEIIGLKVEGLLQEIRKILSGLNYQDKRLGKIIVTGGGSILEGFLERAEKVFAQPVKMGFLYAVNDNHIQAQSAVYATSIGLIHFGAQGRTKKGRFAREKFSPLMHRLRRAKQLYDEYF